MSQDQGLYDRGATVIHVRPWNSNITWEEGPFNYTTYLGIISLGWCDNWRPPQHLIFQLANACFFLSYAVPSTKKGILFMHAALVLGFFIFSAWAWIIVCAPDIFFWNSCYTVINLFQLIFLLYRMRPVKFDPELEEAYHTLFTPFKVTRIQFKKLINNDMAQIISLHAGEAYALQNLTRTDRLGLLLSGKLNVLCDGHFLHPILACEFLDSPEFESRANMDDKFKVSIVAATSCRYLYWQRTSLEYLFAKETYLATVMSTLIARDITTKLYAMNNKIVTEKGYHLDIRLPSITSSLTSGDHKNPSFKALVKHKAMLSGVCQNSNENDRDRGGRVKERVGYPTGYYPSLSKAVTGSRERLFKEKKCGPVLPNGRVPEMMPLNEVVSNDDVGSSAEVESWLESASKYHSCEVVDE